MQPLDCLHRNITTRQYQNNPFKLLLMIANHPFTLTSLHLQIVIAKGECSVRIRQQRNTSEGHLALSFGRPPSASARIRPSIQSFWPIPLWASAARSECNGDGSRSPFERACGGGLQPFRRRSRWQWWLRASRRVGPVTDPLHLTFLGEGREGRGGIRITGGGWDGTTAGQRREGLYPLARGTERST